MSEKREAPPPELREITFTTLGKNLEALGLSSEKVDLDVLSEKYGCEFSIESEEDGDVLRVEGSLDEAMQIFDEIRQSTQNP